MKNTQAPYPPRTRADQRERELALATGAKQKAVRRLQPVSAGIAEADLAIAALKRPFYETTLQSALLLRLGCIIPALRSDVGLVSLAKTVRMAP